MAADSIWQAEVEGLRVRIEMDTTGVKRRGRLFVNDTQVAEVRRMMTLPLLEGHVPTSRGLAAIRVKFSGLAPSVRCELTWNDAVIPLDVVKTRWILTFPAWVDRTLGAAMLAGVTVLAWQDSHWMMLPVVAYTLIRAIPYEPKPVHR